MESSLIFFYSSNLNSCCCVTRMAVVSMLRWVLLQRVGGFSIFAFDFRLAIQRGDGFFFHSIENQRPHSIVHIYVGDGGWGKIENQDL